MNHTVGKIVIVVLVMFAAVAEAKIPKSVKTGFEAQFTPAVWHRGLDTAASELEKDKLKTFVVVEKGGLIPAERAYYFIAPAEYEYRGAEIDGDNIKTRRGEVYMRLPKGAIMAVAGVVYSGNSIHLKLISLEKMKSDADPKLKPTRVTVMLGFKFDKDVLKSADMEKIFPTVDKWVKPFSSYEEALSYSNPSQGLDPTQKTKRPAKNHK